MLCALLPGTDTDPANRNRVSAVWYQAGRTFKASGTNALVAEFRQ